MQSTAKQHNRGWNSHCHRTIHCSWLSAYMCMSSTCAIPYCGSAKLMWEANTLESSSTQHIKQLFQLYTGQLLGSACCHLSLIYSPWSTYEHSESDGFTQVLNHGIGDHRYLCFIMSTPTILIRSLFCYANKLSRTRAPAIDVSGIVSGDALLLSVDAVAAASHKHSHSISGPSHCRGCYSWKLACDNLVTSCVCIGISTSRGSSDDTQHWVQLIQQW